MSGLSQQACANSMVRITSKSKLALYQATRVTNRCTETTAILHAYEGAKPLVWQNPLSLDCNGQKDADGMLLC